MKNAEDNAIAHALANPSSIPLKSEANMARVRFALIFTSSANGAKASAVKNDGPASSEGRFNTEVDILLGRKCYTSDLQVSLTHW